MDKNQTLKNSGGIPAEFRIPGFPAYQCYLNYVRTIIMVCSIKWGLCTLIARIVYVSGHLVEFSVRNLRNLSQLISSFYVQYD